MSDEWTVNSEEKKAFLIKHINEQWEKHHFLNVKVKTGKQRTNLQNAALHKYCELLASNLNENGFDLHMVLNNDIEEFSSLYNYSKMDLKEEAF